VNDDAGESLDEDRLGDELQSLVRRRGQLQALLLPLGSQAIATAEANVDDLRVSVADLDAQIQELTDSLEDAPEAEIKRIALDYANNNSTLTRAKQARDGAETVLREQQRAVHQLLERYAELSSGDNDLLQVKSAAISELADLFEAAVDHYRRLLSDRVEHEASRVFRLLRTQEEYEGLSINAGYGLTIVHKDGEPIPIRSAGYEHLVALSLLAALQRSAPIKGPVILDSPFGRLDSDHTARVVSSLPEFADQVILLAYENEFDREAAASALGSRLVSEKKLRQLNARHTVIEDRL
jgi:DNA sulfur modification protein DndD